MGPTKLDWPPGAAGEVAFALLLRSGLRRMPSTLNAQEWGRVVAPLALATRIFLVLRLMFGLNDKQIGEFCGVTKGLVNERLKKAAVRLAGNEEVMRILCPNRDPNE